MPAAAPPITDTQARQFADLGASLRARRKQLKVNATTAAQAAVLADYPQLKRLAWQLPGAKALTPQEALNLYERNWRHVDVATLTPRERILVQQLAATLGGGQLLV